MTPCTYLSSEVDDKNHWIAIQDEDNDEKEDGSDSEQGEDGSSGEEEDDEDEDEDGNSDLESSDEDNDEAKVLYIKHR